MVNLNDFYLWFHEYYRRYYSSDPGIMKMVQYKENHSERVARDSRKLAQSMGLAQDGVELAELIGLLHDIARAEQAQLGTFRDSPSFDHGDIGEVRLREEGVLKRLSPDKQETILFAVKYHNKRLIPAADPEKTLFAKIARDADKLDIFRNLPTVAAEHKYSPVLVEFLKKGQIAPYEEAKAAGDKILIRMGWFFDINYPWTLSQLVAGGYADQLMDLLPDSSEFVMIKENFKKYLRDFPNIAHKAANS